MGMLQSKIQMLLTTRARAAARGDWGVVRACDADLARAGYVATSPQAPVPGPVETTEAAALPETAVPEMTPRRGPGRPRKQP